MLSGIESTIEVDRYHLLPIADIHVGDWSHISRNTRIVKCAIKAAKTLFGELDKALIVVFVADIASKISSMSIALFDLPN